MRIAFGRGMASRINVVRTLTSGLLAGVVIMALNVAAQLVLSERVQREMNAWMPGAADRMQAGGAAVVAGLVMKLAIGVVLVWLYAAARPRLGPGPKTASLIALAVWLLGAIFFSDFPLTGMIPRRGLTRKGDEGIGERGTKRGKVRRRQRVTPRRARTDPPHAHGRHAPA